jgi:triphosphoribosyl-dephospho-CoA synthase
MTACSNCLNLSPLELLSRALLDGLKAELYLTPKPGLVDLNNSGSHEDLSLDLMSRSIALMRTYLDDICCALNAGKDWSALVTLGQQAESRMFLATGTNCHRGGIFLCGLLLIAASRSEDPSDPIRLQIAVKEAASEFFRAKKVINSHGNRVRAEYPLAGIVTETLSGLPAVFDVFLPALDDITVNPEHRAFLGMAGLMQVVNDSTSLHRCGADGLDFVKKAGCDLELRIRNGEDPRPHLLSLDVQFQKMNLTMGGVADLLGLGLGYANYRILNDHLQGLVQLDNNAIPLCYSSAQLTA